MAIHANLVAEGLRTGMNPNLLVGASSVTERGLRGASAPTSMADARERDAMRREDGSDNTAAEFASRVHGWSDWRIATRTRELQRNLRGKVPSFIVADDLRLLQQEAQRRARTPEEKEEEKLSRYYPK
jgi:hypothetical protein